MSGPDVSNLITVEQAMAIIDAAVIQPRVVTVSLRECAGSFLAEDLRSDRDAPPFDKSLMDGYAVRAADVESVPCELAIAGTVAAGGLAETGLQAGQTMSIMTGAPLPMGADAVVPVETTRIIAGSNRVKILETAPAGRYIARRGCEATAGSVVLKSGTQMGAAQIAVAASIGAASLRTFALPEVAVLGTGDELVSPEETPTGPQIRSCNNAMLIALMGRFPSRALDLGFVPDNPAAIEEKIETGLSRDILLVTGGMSMGQRDYVPEILRKLGGDLKITKLRIKPGKPFVFAEIPGGKFVFGLPGNPVSAFVCTLCLASRLVMRMAGGPAGGLVRNSPLAQPLEGNGPRTFYQPAIFDGQSLRPLKWIGSADIYTLSRANALIIRPENQGPQAAGAVMEFLEI